MLTIRIEWNKNSAGLLMYSVFCAEHYTVDVLNDDTTRLLLDNTKHDICIGKGTKVYVMNDRGSTIDTIIG